MSAEYVWAWDPEEKGHVPPVKSPSDTADEMLYATFA
jgi:hypothetical protein